MGIESTTVALQLHSCVPAPRRPRHINNLFIFIATYDIRELVLEVKS